MKSNERFKKSKRFIFALLVTINLLGFSVASAQPALTRALDFDSDGKADPSVFRSEGNEWWISKSSGGHFVSTFGAAAISTLTPGDYDGDGKADLSVWIETSGTFWYFRSSNNSVVSIQFGQPGDEPVARDYDGDGNTDCAIVRRENGYLVWWILQSLSNSVLVLQYGIATDSPVPGDYDGDGHFDTAVQRQNGQSLFFYGYQSSAGSFAVEWGYYSDLVVPGDYDGDGKTDLAVCRWDFRQGDFYEWWVLRSSDSQPKLYTYGDADAGDIPVQADYDGDGITDVAVWRSFAEPSSLFYIRRSSNQQELVLGFGKFGDLPLASYDTH